ncbi:Lcl C-terminal domain-containing protein [Thalassolituus marinus]|uniref:DUF1566 domain-containing protein n=1 Tax=Thalassolituus marinus TaxID=671053 RepID=A0ABS7ZUX0_9GAMM|nr:DUF1566 domain-containing protein [Thalassolituus marinus]MCA6065382.1 DUF1566 domain-containing protein [Thalassolituus marinus]
MNKSVFFLWFALVPHAVLGQVCNSSMEVSGESGRFVNLNDGFVLDVVTMLRWDFCTYGQTYENGNCSGSPMEYATWQDALGASASASGRRLPNIKELATLVERSCIEPAINQDVFPDTPLYVYWSNTPASSGEGMIIDFTDGSEIIRDINRPRVMRLIAE